MDKRNVLAEANDLVSNGLRQAAIDLLLEYLGFDPDSAQVLTLLGRTYLLNHQPEKAVPHLQKSLAITQGSVAYETESSTYEAEAFNDGDLDFVTSQADSSAENMYRLDDDESSQTPKGEEKQNNPNSRSTLTITATKSGCRRSERNKKGVEIFYKGRKRPTAKTDADLAMSGVFNRTDGNDGNATPPPVKDTPPVTAAAADELPGVEAEIQYPHADSRQSTELERQYLTVGEEIDDQLWGDEGSPAASVYAENDGFLGDEQLLFDEYFEEDRGNEKPDDVRPTLDLEQETELGQLFWDDFEELNDFEENAQRAVEKVQSAGRISPEARARQIASEVLSNADWDPKCLSLLQQIFIENGWSACRRAIERAIDRGLSPEELRLARKIRLFWVGNERFWTTFSRINSNVRGTHSHAIYKNISWVASIKLIRCFPSLPDIEEVYSFIEDAFDFWYCSQFLRNTYPSFNFFIISRVDSMGWSLPGETLFSFLYYDYSDADYDDDRLSGATSPAKQELLTLGIHLSQ